MHSSGFPLHRKQGHNPISEKYIVSSSPTISEAYRGRIDIISACFVKEIKWIVSHGPTRINDTKPLCASSGRLISASLTDQIYSGSTSIDLFFSIQTTSKKEPLPRQQHRKKCPHHEHHFSIAGYSPRSGSKRKNL